MNIFEKIAQMGKIEYNDFEINHNQSMQEQLDDLKEDLFQVSLPNNFLLDFGWYPSFSPEGCFKASLIKDYDWSNPISTKSAQTFKELEKSLGELISDYKSLEKKL